MISPRLLEKITYASRNNNIDSSMIVSAVEALSEGDSDKVVRNVNIPYSINYKHSTIDSVGWFFNWGIMQVPGALFMENKHLAFSATTVVHLLQPIYNLDAACKLLRMFKKNTSSWKLAFYQYLTCDFSSDPDYGLVESVIARILEPERTGVID